MFAGDDTLILEPEIEEIAGQHQVIPGLGDLLEKRVERCADGGRHLTEMRVGHDNHARGGGATRPKLRNLEPRTQAHYCSAMTQTQRLLLAVGIVALAGVAANTWGPTMGTGPGDACRRQAGDARRDRKSVVEGKSGDLGGRRII